jgi:two-component system phosphate regulon sensor histidine kinase PhoR
MFRPRSLGWPITLGVVMIVLLVALTVGWVLMAVDLARVAGYWWAILAVGTIFLVLVLVGVVLYLLISVKEINLNQRQSNFIDSVTHELKSPIASLKLYLQTLSRRTVTEQQQADFYHFMLVDLERLDTLINHLLDAARLDHKPAESEVVEVDLPALLANCAETSCARYRVPSESVRLDTAPAVVRARPVELEMVFRNLIDNALKYSGEKPEVTVHCRPGSGETVVTRVVDNGPGIPPKLRSKIFRRFVRLGNELERIKPGTGLGLFIVRNLVKRLHGKITVAERAPQQGTIFEVELPGRVDHAPS